MAILSNVLSLGDDQMSSQYQVLFPGGIPGGGSGENIALRLDQSVDVPAEAVGEYEYYHKGLKITKPNMVDETDKHVALQVRIDQQWAVFDDIKNWKRIVHDPHAGTRLAWALVNCTMLVQALDGENSVVKTIKMTGCVIKDFKITAFEPNGAEPARIEINLIVGSIDYE